MLPAMTSQMAPKNYYYNNILTSTDQKWQEKEWKCDIYLNLYKCHLTKTKPKKKKNSLYGTELPAFALFSHILPIHQVLHTAISLQGEAKTNFNTSREMKWNKKKCVNLQLENWPLWCSFNL